MYLQTPSPHYYRDPRGALQYRLQQDEFYSNQCYTSEDLLITRDFRFLVYLSADPGIKIDLAQDDRESIICATANQKAPNHYSFLFFDDMSRE